MKITHICDEQKYLLCIKREAMPMVLTACAKKDDCRIHMFAKLPTSTWKHCKYTGEWQVRACPVCGFKSAK